MNRIALEQAPYGRGTVGCIDVHPNSRNVIPGRVKLSVDLRAADVGSQVTLGIGNKVPWRAANHRSPVAVTGIVRAITDGEYTISGPTYTGQRAFMGRAAVLDTDKAQLLVTERTHEPWDLGVFESVGIDPRRARFLLLKSRMYCRPVFVPIAAGLVECDSRGVTSSNYGLFEFERLKRPAYPLNMV